MSEKDDDNPVVILLTWFFMVCMIVLVIWVTRGCFKSLEGIENTRLGQKIEYWLSEPNNPDK